MSWGAIGAAAVSAYISYTASEKAEARAKAGQKKAGKLTREQMAMQEEQFERLLALGEPYRAAGEQGLAQYQAYLEDPTAMYEDPGYQAMLKQGMTAMEGSAAARGTQLSGRTLAGLQDLGMATASQYRSQIMGELANLANIGSTAIGQAYGVGGQQMQQIGGAYQNLATLAQQSGMMGAAGEMGRSAALTSALGTMGAAYAQSQQED